MWFFSLLFFSTIASSIALSIPPSPSILQVGASPPSTTTPPLSPPEAAWPSVPWSYEDGSKITIFSEYGRDASPALSQSIQFATLDIENMIIKGPASYKARSVAFREGIVTMYMLFSGKVEVSKEEIFRTLDIWRVHAGAFGAREIAEGKIVAAQAPIQVAAFTIRFDRFEDVSQS